VHAALGDYRCRIDHLVATDTRAAARMQFEGVHRGRLLGVEPTGRRIVWAGAAFFTLRDGLIAELWVLGDLDAIKRQLAARGLAGDR